MSKLDERASERRRLDVDADIRTASTLPGWFYSDAALFDSARERVFAASWQLLADGRELPESSCVKPVTMLEGCLDEPLLLARDAAGSLRCLSNVCTHRGNLVQCGAARKTVLTCAYHGRKFELDGKLRSAPEFEGAADFPSARDDLARIPLESLHGFLFASLRPSHAFDELTGDLARRMSWFPFDHL